MEYPLNLLRDLKCLESDLNILYAAGYPLEVQREYVELFRYTEQAKLNRLKLGLISFDEPNLKTNFHAQINAQLDILQQLKIMETHIST